MHVHHVGFRIKGFYRLAQFGHRWEMTPNDAQHRLTILQFFARYGQAATGEAFGVSRRTLYRWKQTFTQADGDPRALAARSSAPCRRRQSMWPPALSQEIRRLRTTYPNLGQAKLPVLLRPWCAQQNLALPSVSHTWAPHRPSARQAAARPQPSGRPWPPQTRGPAPQSPPTQGYPTWATPGVRLRYRGASPSRPPPRPVHLHRPAHPLRRRLCRRHPV